MLLGRTNEELNVLKKTFFDKYNEDLAVLMDSELGGDFKKVILAALQVITNRWISYCHHRLGRS